MRYGSPSLREKVSTVDALGPQTAALFPSARLSGGSVQLLQDFSGRDRFLRIIK